MAAPRDPGRPEAPNGPGRRHLGYAAALSAGIGTPILLMALPWIVHRTGLFETAASLGLLAFALAFPRLSQAVGAPLGRSYLRLLAVAGGLLAVVSIVTGFQNGLTDEPYTTVRYAGLLFGGHNPYGTPLIFQYVQYGTTYSSQSYYVYLPLLQFAFVPGLDYKWVALAAWAGMVFLVRNDRFAAVLLAQPYAALMAASGYNDLLVLLLLTLGFVGIGGRRQRWAEWLALGMKQFANILVLAYYAFRRDLRGVLVTAALTAAFLIPFVVWSPIPTLCNSLLYGTTPACAPFSNHDEPGWNWNYTLYPLWTLAAFHPQVGRFVRGNWERLRRRWVRSTLAPLLTQFGEYALVGLSGVVVNLLLFAVAQRGVGATAPALLAASGLAFAGALLWNFVWNYRWTFRGRTGRPIPVHLTFYAVIQVGALGINLFVLAGLVAAGVEATLAQLGGILVASGAGFAANLRWNFVGAAPVRSSGTGLPEAVPGSGIRP